MLAAKEQMEYIVKKHNSLSIYAKSAYALSCLTVYNKQLANGNKISKQTVLETRNNISTIKKYVYKNDNISFSRKIEMFLFDHFISLYNVIIKIHSR